MTKYIKLTALTFDEYSVESIEGRATGGSVNVDGASAVRRTCSLSLVTENLDINFFYWALDSKVKIELGIQDENFEDEIKWYKLGTYIITSFNQSYSTNGYSISISGKDKMCLLNGEVGGALPALIDFGQIEEVIGEGADAVLKRTRLPLKQIITEAVHTYALEPYGNIIIRDMDDDALELLEYRGDEDSPLFILKTVQGDSWTYTLDQDYKVYMKDNPNNPIPINSSDIVPDNLIDDIDIQADEPPTILYPNDSWDDGQSFTLVKVKYGDAVGYRTTELIYMGELISSFGEALTSILDKIKNMLGDYEYFYNEAGQFVWQRKPSHVNISWNTLRFDENYKEIYAENAAYNQEVTYNFRNNELISSFQNTPNLLNLRNDYSVWGQRETISGAQVPIHARYAIQEKPEKYTSISVTEQEAEEYKEQFPNIFIKDAEDYEQESTTYIASNDLDWRELIFQMQKDFYRYGVVDDFAVKLKKANPWVKNGHTGYEQYYLDFQGFWRQLYELENSSKGHFIEEVTKEPYKINFYFDLLAGANGDLEKYSVDKIGDRTKVVNDNSVKSIYYQGIPPLVYYDPSKEKITPSLRTGYTYVQMPQSIQDTMFSISGRGKSAKEAIESLLYSFSACAENVTLTCIPVYELQPNTKIRISDDTIKLEGDYIVNRITIPLAYNGTMSISATKVISRII